MLGSRPYAGWIAGAVLAAAVALLAACGGGDADDAERPAVTSKAAATGEPTTQKPAGAQTTPEPGYAGIVKRQKGKPNQRFTPCNLVTKTQARAILRAPVLEPREALQGPTCIYATARNTTFVTVAVQAADITDLKRPLRNMRRVRVGSRSAYCGTIGRPVLYVSLRADRVLTIVASCNVAQRFATTALARLKT